MDSKPAVELYEYQKNWIRDKSRFLEGRWSRQSGKSFSSAAKIVLDCREREGVEWVSLSSGERQAKEFMRKIRMHAEITEKAIKWHEETYRFKNSDGLVEEYKSLEATLRNGSRVLGIPANEDTARGYTANVYLDEFSTHKNSRGIWAAVFPIASRTGHQLMVTYTPKGKQNKAYEISTNPIFSHHIVDIYQAVAQGCPQNIEELRAGIGDPDLWAQEYEVQFLDEATAFLTYEQINEVESEMAGEPELYAGGYCYLGMDIGRRRDLTILWLLEMVGDVLWTRELVELRRKSFAEQDQGLERIMRAYRPLRVCIDQTGMGEKPVEDAQRKYGELGVEGVIFSAPVKLDLANGLKRRVEDRRVRIPVSQDVRDDLHSVKKITTAAGNMRFDVEQSEKGHADRFWALALAIHAAGEDKGPVEYRPVTKRRFAEMSGAF